MKSNYHASCLLFMVFSCSIFASALHNELISKLSLQAVRQFLMRFDLRRRLQQERENAGRERRKGLRWLFHCFWGNENENGN